MSDLTTTPVRQFQKRRANAINRESTDSTRSISQTSAFTPIAATPAATSSGDMAEEGDNNIGVTRPSSHPRNKALRVFPTAVMNFSDPPAYKIILNGSASLTGPHTRAYQPIYIEEYDGPYAGGRMTFRYSLSISYSINSNERRLLPADLVLKQTNIGQGVLYPTQAPWTGAAATQADSSSHTQLDRVHPFCPIIVNVKRSSLHALSRTIYQLYLRQYSQDRDSAMNRYDWQIGWVDRCTVDFFRRLAPFQKVNHVPGIELLSKKRNIVMLVNHVSSSAKDAFRFFPRSWNLPRDKAAFVEYAKERLAQEIASGVLETKRSAYIVKPGSSCQGRGIYLIQKPEQLKAANNHIVSEYIPRPLLINGKKFDLRIYVVITSASPLRIYAFQEGLARFCTEDYQPPSEENLSHIFSHLTNYSLNKKNVNSFKAAGDNANDGDGDNDGDNDSPVNTQDKKTKKKKTDDDDGDGNGDGDDDEGDGSSDPDSSKWTITQLNSYLTREYGADRVREVWSNINDVMVRTIITAAPVMRTVYKAIFNKEATGARAFQLIGFDIMLDETLTPWLIEVNRNPSLHCDAHLDHHIKTMMLGQLLRIVDPCNSQRPPNAPNGSLPLESRSKLVSSFTQSCPNAPAVAIDAAFTVATEEDAIASFGARSHELEAWRAQRRDLELQYRLEHEDYTVNLLQSVASHTVGVNTLREDRDLPPLTAPQQEEDLAGFEGKIPGRKTLKVPYMDIPYSADVPAYPFAWHRLYPVAAAEDYPFPPQEGSARAKELNSPAYIISQGTPISTLKRESEADMLLKRVLPPSYPLGTSREKAKLQEFYDKLLAITTERSTSLDGAFIREAYSNRMGLTKPTAASNPWVLRPIGSTGAAVAASGPGAIAVAAATAAAVVPTPTLASISPTSNHSSSDAFESLVTQPDSKRAVVGSRSRRAVRKSDGPQTSARASLEKENASPSM